MKTNVKFVKFFLEKNFANIVGGLKILYICRQLVGVLI